MKQKSFKLSNIGVYVQDEYDRRQARSFKKQGWAGLSMLLDCLSRKRYLVDFCGRDNVHKYRVVLVSLTCATDWYSFIKERLKWKSGNYTVIIGGNGVANIRPFLKYGDIFVFGRAEDIIVELIDFTLRGLVFDHPSVCYRESFSADKKYYFNQAQQCYPYEIALLNNKRWQELGIGCQRKCLFCMYSWHRKHIGETQDKSGSADSMWGSTIESTLFQLDLENPNSWPEAAWMIFGFDGVSERLRRMVNKPITNDMLTMFFKGLPKYRGKTHKIKLYNIVGYPTETEDDWNELRELIYSSNPPRIERDGQTPKVEIHSTPFKPPPCTPVATWPVEYTNFRGLVTEKLKHQNCKMYKHGIYAGRFVDFNSSYGVESLPTTALWMLAFRGIESDVGTIETLATSVGYNRKNVAGKIEHLESLVDINRIFGWYTWDELPTRYLYSHTPYERMIKMSDAFLRKYGGIDGVKLADCIQGKENEL